MAPDFWQHVKSESAATQKLMSSQWGTELQDVHEELLNISKAAQVLSNILLKMEASYTCVSIRTRQSVKL